MLVGQRLDLDSIAAELSSTTPVMVPPDPGFAIARGAAQTTDGSGFFPAGAATQMGPAASDATAMAPAASDATQMAPAAGDATQMAPAAGDATQMAPLVATRRRWRPLPLLAADATQAQITEPGQVGPQLAYSQEEPDYYEMSADSVEEFVPEQDDEAPYTAVIAPPPPTDSAHGQCDGVRGDELHDAGRRGRRQHPAGRRLRSAAGARHPVANGAGELPA